MKLLAQTKAVLPTKYGLFSVYAYTFPNGEHHVALVKGIVKDKEHVLTRLHSECLTGDVFSLFDVIVVIKSRNPLKRLAKKIVGLFYI